MTDSSSLELWVNTDISKHEDYIFLLDDGYCKQELDEKKEKKIHRISHRLRELIHVRPRAPPSLPFLLRLFLFLQLYTTAFAFAINLPKRLTPIMGWNNCQLDCAPVYPNNAIVRATAKLLRSTGLATIGYTHLNLDDAWMSPERTHTGHLQANPDRFPNFTETLGYVRR